MTPPIIPTATPEQVVFYETFLYPWQDEVLQIVQSDKFYLTGGTCLSRYYYQHRYSDDLDFFFEGHRFDLRAFATECRILQQQLSAHFETELSLESEYFNRLLLHKNNKVLKIEFVYEPTPVVKTPTYVAGVRLDSKENVAANKITAVLGRKTLKDYVDLYYLLQEFDIKQVLDWASDKVILPEYEGMVMCLFGESFVHDALLIKPILPELFGQFVEYLTQQLLAHAQKTS